MPSPPSAQRIVGVCGIVADAMIELMIARLRAEGIEHLFLDMRTFGKEWCIHWGDRGEKTIQDAHTIRPGPVSRVRRRR